MDFSGFLVIPLAALVSALTIIVMASVPKWRARRWFPVSAGLSIFLGVLLMQPWQALSLHEWKMLPIGLGLVAIWALMGCLIGAIPALLGVKAVAIMRRGR